MLLIYLKILSNCPSKDYANLLVKEGLKDYNFIALFNKTHESTQHSYPELAQGLLPNMVPQPSFAPVVIVTSVSGFSCLPHNGE